MEQINKLFVEFLKNNHALKQYVKNIRTTRKDHFLTWENHINPFTIYPLRDYFLDSNCTSGLIMGSFVWIDTLEGQYFWEDLDAKWREICRSYNTT